MLRRSSGRRPSGVVVQWVVVEDTAPLNASQAAKHTADDAGEGFGVGGGLVHARDGASPLARCTDSRGPEHLPILTTDRDRDLRQALRTEGHTCTSLAVLLGVSETTAKRLLRGERPWTDYQRAKLARGRAA